MRTVQYLVAVTLVGSLVGSASAEAQTCLGLAPIGETNRGSVGMSVAFTEGANALSFVAIGGTPKAFGGGNLSWNRVENSDISSVSVGGVFGGQVAADANRRIVICPIGEAAYEYGPNDVGGTGLDLSTLSLFGGVSAGFVVVDTSAVQIVPMVGFVVGGTTLWARLGGESESVHDTYGVIRAGVGLVLNRRTSIVPVVAFPVGLVISSDPTFSISFLWGF